MPHGSASSPPLEGVIFGLCGGLANDAGDARLTRGQRVQADPGASERLVLDSLREQADSVAVLELPAMHSPRRRPKPPKITFYPEPVDRGDTWRLLAHSPGSPVKYIAGFKTKSDAEAWASGPEAVAWISANYQRAAPRRQGCS